MKLSRISTSNFRYQAGRHGWPSLIYTKYPSKVLSFSSCNHKCGGHTGQIMNLYFYLTQTHVGFRFYSVISAPASRSKKMPTDKHRPGAISKGALKIVDILRDNDCTVESKLDFIDKKLSIALVAQVFQVLNSKKRPALHLFHWIRRRHPDWGRNPDICSLVINNCGFLDDSDAMRGLLSDFRMKGLSLTRKAFEYLSVMAANEAMLKESTEKVIIMLKEVGGICYLTGVHALIELFGVLGSFYMAKFVIDRTERRLSNYNLLFKEMCRRCEFEGARNLLDEMRNEGYPFGRNYNYFISNLIKKGEIGVAYRMFQEMKEKDCSCSPDALTYEVFICHYCNDGNMELAFEFLADMISRGIRPRLSTHAAVIRGFFRSHKYEEAHRYVVESDDKYSRPVNYSLLARLYLKTGNVVKAENILSEMVEKGLRPNNKVYEEVRKRLQKAGLEKLAMELEIKLCQLEHGS